MTVDEFLSDLYNDELSDMFIGNRNSREESRPKLFPLMNKAMLQAYARYTINFDTEQLVVTEDETTYVLEAEDLLAVVAVTNVYGRELRADEVRILGQTLVFPEDHDAAEYQVAYKTKPLRFTEEQDDEEVILDLPELLIPWMSSWVAARIFLGKKDEASQAEGVKYMTLAKTFSDLYEDTNTTNEFTREDSAKLCARGFA